MEADERIPPPDPATPPPLPAGAVALPVRVDFQLTEEEYRDAVEHLRRRQPDWYKPLLRAAFVGGVIACSLLLFGITGEGGRGVVAGAVPLGLMSLFVAAFPWFRPDTSVADGWAAYRAAGAFTCEFDPASAVVAIDDSTAEYRWRAFVRVSETPTCLLLHRRGGQVLIVPLRAFASPAELAAVRGMAAEFGRLPAGGGLPARTGGFPVEPAR
jgi:hypothetical protein